MRFLSLAILAIVSFVSFGGPARAEQPLSIVFSGNSWGYLKPCPT